MGIRLLRRDLSLKGSSFSLDVHGQGDSKYACPVRTQLFSIESKRERHPI